MSNAMKQLLTRLAMHRVKFKMTGDKTIEIDGYIQVIEYAPGKFGMMVREQSAAQIWGIIRRVRL